MKLAFLFSKIRRKKTAWEQLLLKFLLFWSKIALKKWKLSYALKARYCVRISVFYLKTVIGDAISLIIHYWTFLGYLICIESELLHINILIAYGKHIKTNTYRLKYPSLRAFIKHISSYIQRFQSNPCLAYMSSNCKSIRSIRTSTHTSTYIQTFWPNKWVFVLSGSYLLVQ